MVGFIRFNATLRQPKSKQLASILHIDGFEEDQLRKGLRDPPGLYEWTNATRFAQLAYRAVVQQGLLIAAALGGSCVGRARVVVGVLFVVASRVWRASLVLSRCEAVSSRLFVG